MGKYKVCVYTICKNESKFVDRWIDSMKEADYICVLDTGSTDNTVDLLKKHNVIVKQEIINPWRFDVARNKSMELIPKDSDICVCTDLDEVFNKGWREELENIWNDNTNRIQYIYNWKLDEFDNPIVSFYYEKIHSLDGYKWIYPVHEILYTDNKENYVKTDKIVLNHYPDCNKSRSNYLKLLEQSVKEFPNSDRNIHYLGREYMYHKEWNKAIDTLIKHINMKESTWCDERCASMRFIARCYQNINRYDEAIMWLEKAIKEAPYLRDPYVEYAILEYKLKDYNKVIELCNKALDIPINNRTYINEPFTFDETVYDLLSISYYNINDYNASLKYVKKALAVNEHNERIKNNYNIIKKQCDDINM